LKVYSEYVTNYQTHIATINEKLNDMKMVSFLKVIILLIFVFRTKNVIFRNVPPQ